jgi:FMN phosphatase YigB (HAD superfamily)
MKTLFVTDFDDTLAKTDANVYVTSGDGKPRAMSPEEYAVYDAKPDDKFDFSEFEQLKNPRAISRFTELLKKVVDEKKADKVAVLTARGHTKPIAKFLQAMGITSGVSIAALGDSDPKRKANYIEKHIKDGYSRVLFVDDSPKNIEAVKQLKTQYPKVKLIAHHVKHKDQKKTEPIDTTDADKSVPKSMSSLSNTPRVSKADMEALYKTKITNPKTGKQILVLTALKNKDHPMYKHAMGMVAQMARQKNPNN